MPVKEQWEYKHQFFSCSELAKIAKCSTSTMRYRLKHHTVEQSVAMGSGKTKDNKDNKTIFGTCKCGCGKSLYSNRQIWYDNSKCRLKWIYAAIESGEVKPTKYGTCENENCKVEFPRYKDIPSSMSKRYCCYSCSREAQNDKVDRKAIAKAKQEALKKFEPKPKVTKVKPEDRNSYCIRKLKKCEHYNKWLEFPNFTCLCEHGYTEPKVDKNKPMLMSAIDTTSPSNMRHGYESL